MCSQNESCDDQKAWVRYSSSSSPSWTSRPPRAFGWPPVEIGSSLFLLHKPYNPITGEEPLKSQSLRQTIEAPKEVLQPYLNVLIYVARSHKLQLHEFQPLPSSCTCDKMNNIVLCPKSKKCGLVVYFQNITPKYGEKLKFYWGPFHWSLGKGHRYTLPLRFMLMWLMWKES